MIDIERLLLPVSVQQECGTDLAFTAEVDEISRARQHDDPTLDQGEWTATLKEADWHLVAIRCEELIQTRSKDLQLAVWLTEALALTRRFRGAGEGFALIAALIERYWDGLYPLPEADDHERRIGNLFWLANRAPVLLKMIPVSEDGTISLSDFDAARQRNNSPRNISDAGWPQQGAADLPDIAQLDTHRRRNSAEFNECLLADTRFCLNALEQLETAIDARLGPSGPGFSAARAILQNVIDFVVLLIPNDGIAQPETLPVSEKVSGPLRSRQEALAQLKLIAEFFRQTEPHSPVAYLVDKAAAWGDMPLHIWLRSVVKDPVLASDLDELLGVMSRSSG
jgi:type VI secretion system protein ImpA